MTRFKPENPSVTKHSVLKYIDRITQPKNMDRNEYYTLHCDRLKESILETFKYAKFIYRGQILKNLTQSFYMHRDIVLVVDDVNDKAIITIYKVDFPFPKELTEKVIDDLKIAILDGDLKLSEDKEILSEIVNEKEFEIESLKSELSLLEEKVSLTKSKIQSNVIEIKNVRAEHSINYKVIDTYAEQLLGNTSFKKEAEKMKKEWT